MNAPSKVVRSGYSTVTVTRSATTHRRRYQRAPVGEREFFRSARGDSDCMRPIAADDVKVTGGEENGALLGDQTGRSPNCHVKRRACEPLA